LAQCTLRMSLSVVEPPAQVFPLMQERSVPEFTISIKIINYYASMVYIGTSLLMGNVD
jgi:hypothetical protein